MKKLLVILCVLIFTSVSVLNAGGVIIRPIKVGIGIGVMSDDDQGGVARVDNNGELVEVSSTFRSMGFGLVPGIDFDFNFHENFGMYFGVSYSKGFFRSVKLYENSQTDTKNEQKNKGAYLGVKLGFKTRAELGNFCPYIGGGVLVGLLGNSIVEESFSAVSDVLYEYKTLYQPGVGFTACLGADFKLTERAAFFLQVSGNFINLKRKKTSMTKHTIDGVSVIELDSVRAREVQYRKNAKDDDPFNFDSPTISRYVKDPFSAIEIAIGFCFYVGRI